MAGLLSIASATIDDVRAMLREALRDGLDADRVADFVASVDWSDAAEADQQIRDLLGQLSEWSTEYDEGDLTRAQYVDRLVSLFPEDDARPAASGVGAPGRQLQGVRRRIARLVQLISAIPGWFRPREF